ncbi:MAG: BMP family ABC transporter substrate-binding protein [Acidimicrobiia bacterium]|nr:BMP family ABC transporter substrate-binding protein [Acidimicrobiia bacterium]
MRTRLIKIFVLLTVLTLFAAACSSDGGTTTTEATDGATTTEATDGATTTEATDGTAEDGPTEVSIGLVLSGVKEESWVSSMLETLNRIQAESPHGMTVNYEYFESIEYADGARVIGDLAASGKYDIILGHSLFGESVAQVNDQYPDILFAFSGSGNDGNSGDNAYWIDAYTHEAAYLTGVIAGMMTKTNKISGVAAFPTPNVNAPLNGYIAGAKSVNPDVTAKVTYLESWFDPTGAKESATAQIAAGSDIIYAEREGPWEAAKQHEGVYVIGHWSDESSVAPEVILTSTLALWDPAMNFLIETWYAHEAAGTPYDAPSDRIVYSMADGGCDIAPMSDLVPADVQAKVMEVKGEIMNRELEIPLNPAPIE